MTTEQRTDRRSGRKSAIARFSIVASIITTVEMAILVLLFRMLQYELGWALPFGGLACGSGLLVGSLLYQTFGKRSDDLAVISTVISALASPIFGFFLIAAWFGSTAGSGTDGGQLFFCVTLIPTLPFALISGGIFGAGAGCEKSDP